MAFACYGNLLWRSANFMVSHIESHTHTLTHIHTAQAQTVIRSEGGKTNATQSIGQMTWKKWQMHTVTSAIYMRRIHGNVHADKGVQSDDVHEQEKGLTSQKTRQYQYFVAGKCCATAKQQLCCAFLLCFSQPRVPFVWAEKKTGENILFIH